MGAMKNFAMLLLIVILAGCNFLIPQKKSAIQPETVVAVPEGIPSVTYGELVSPSLELTVSQPPKRFKAIDNSNCRLPQASRHSKVYYYHIYQGSIPVPLYYAWANSVGEVDKETPWLKSPDRIDVVVTETEQPVYLVLGSYNSVFWNIQLADGAQLDGVSVISYHGGLISNVKQSRRVGFSTFNNRQNRSCYKSPTNKQKSVKSRIKLYRENAGSEPSKSTIEDWEENIAEADEWFNKDLPKLIGKRVDVIIKRSGRSYSPILVGPVLSTPTKPQLVEEILHPSNLKPFWGNAKVIKEKLGFTKP